MAVYNGPFIKSRETPEFTILFYIFDGAVLQRAMIDFSLVESDQKGCILRVGTFVVNGLVESQVFYHASGRHSAEKCGVVRVIIRLGKAQVGEAVSLSVEPVGEQPFL